LGLSFWNILSTLVNQLRNPLKKGRLRICLNFSGDSFSSFSPKTCHLF